jgi:transcription elongation GreA/GreB family factor
MDKQNRINNLTQEISENSHDVRENAFHGEQKDKLRLIEFAMREEQRLLNNLPGTPPMTFGLGSSMTVKYLSADVPAFTATIVAIDIIPIFEWDDDYEPRYKAFLAEWELMRSNGKVVGELKGTPLSVHSPLAQAIYGKINGTYNVVVEGAVHNVEVAFC